MAAKFVKAEQNQRQTTEKEVLFPFNLLHALVAQVQESFCQAKGTREGAKSIKEDCLSLFLSLPLLVPPVFKTLVPRRKM